MNEEFLCPTCEGLGCPGCLTPEEIKKLNDEILKRAEYMRVCKIVSEPYAVILKKEGVELKVPKHLHYGFGTDFKERKEIMERDAKILEEKNAG